jgi:hypothetical protein
MGKKYNHKGDLGKYGVCFMGETCYNNQFEVGYGTPPSNAPVDYFGQMSHVVHATFNNGVWRFSGWEPKKHEIGRQEFQVPQELQDLVVKAILDNDILRGNLEKWRKDRIRRLSASIPRAKQRLKEMEAEIKSDEAILDTLKSVSF